MGFCLECMRQKGPARLKQQDAQILRSDGEYNAAPVTPTGAAHGLSFPDCLEASRSAISAQAVHMRTSVQLYLKRWHEKMTGIN